MQLRRRKIEAVDSADRLPKTRPIACLGEACTRYAGAECAAYEELIQTNGKSGGIDLPPLKGDASWAIYGRVCRPEGPSDRIVSITTVALKPTVGVMELMAHGERYGLPNTIERGDKDYEMNQNIISASPSDA